MFSRALSLSILCCPQLALRLFSSDFLVSNLQRRLPVLNNLIKASLVSLGPYYTVPSHLPFLYLLLHLSYAPDLNLGKGEKEGGRESRVVPGQVISADTALFTLWLLFRLLRYRAVRRARRLVPSPPRA